MPAGSKFSAMEPTRAQLLGVEAVLGTGATVSHLGGLMKDNTGYDLGGFLCGSEGTLGVITAARVRLVPPSPERVVALLAFSSTGAAVHAASLLRRALPDLQSLEFFIDSGLALVCRVTGVPRPFTLPIRPTCSAEMAGQRDPLPAMADVLDSLTAVDDVPWPPMRFGAPNCGATAKATRRPSTLSAHHTSSMSPCPRPPWQRSSTRSPPRQRPTLARPRGCSVTPQTAMST